MARERALQEDFAAKRLHGRETTALVVAREDPRADVARGGRASSAFAISSPMRALVIEWRERHGLAVDERTSDAIFCEWTTHLQVAAAPAHAPPPSPPTPSTSGAFPHSHPPAALGQ